MIRKLLFLCMLILASVGVRGQETVLIDGGTEGITSASDFTLAAADVPSTIQAGDVLKLEYEITQSWYYYIAVATQYTELFHVDSNNKSTSKNECVLTATNVESIKQYGISALNNSIQGLKIKKLTLAHYDAATSVSLNKSSIKLGIGSTYNLLKATVAPSTASQSVTWSVVEGSEYATVDANGVITGVAAGTATVRATSSTDASLYAECTVTVMLGYNLSIAADKTTVLNTSASTVTLTPTVSLEGHEPVAGTDYNIAYTINGNDKVTISNNVVTIAEGAAAGTYTVVATLTPTFEDYAGATATQEIVVDAPLTDAISLSIGNLSFGKDLTGTQQEVSAGLTIDNDAFNGTNCTISAISDNEDIVTVTCPASINQYNSTIKFNIVGTTGTANVTLTVQGTNAAGKVAVTTKTIQVTVTGVPLKFTIGDITVNDDQALTVDAVKAAITKVYTGYDTDPQLVESGYSVEMKYNGEAVTSVPAQGGNVDSYTISVNVKATNPEYADAEAKDVIVTVTHLKSFNLSLSLDKTTIKANGHETATITPSSVYTPAEGDPTNVEVTYTCVSSDPTVATAAVVDGNIVVTAQKAGTVTVTVTATPTAATEYATMQATSAEITVTQAMVTLTKETIDGKEYVQVYVPEGGAFGDISDNPAITALSDATVAELKAAANVKVTGNISNSDVQELIHLIGDSNNATENLCASLDMGDATMTEALELAEDGTWNKDSWIEDYFGHNLWFLENLTLPRPIASGDVIPTGMYNLWDVSATLFKSLTIPEGWTAVADHAFADGSGNGLKSLTSLTLANSITTIGAYAFVNANVLETLTMPSNLVEIKEYAFANYYALENLNLNEGLVKIGAHAFEAMNNVVTLYMPTTIDRIDEAAFLTKEGRLMDIYFTGHAPHFVHTGAFDSSTQMCNNTVEDTQIQNVVDPSITRNEYKVGDVLACIMHYPKEYESEYIDVTRVYDVLPADLAYQKGNLTFTPEGWTDEFIAAVNAKNTTGIGTTVDYGVKDKTYGYTFIWPSQAQMTNGYYIAKAGYKWNTEPLDPDQYDPSATYENGGVDKRGLYQFIVGMGNAPKDKDKWVFPQNYEQNKWYTFSVPFDMSVEQIKNVFGATTQVCRISKVIRDTESTPKQLRLEFRKSVMEEEDDRPEDITYPDDVTQAGIRHHYPYMIKPSSPVSELAAEFKEDGKRVLPNYESIPGNLMEEKQTAVDKDGNAVSVSGVSADYYFRPILMEGKLKKNSYVLANYKDKHQFVFFKGVKNATTNEYEDGGTANANTAYVQLLHGSADNEGFFTASVNDVKFASYFGEMSDDDATDVEKVEIVCGNDNIANDKIYTISGVLVSGKSLTPGLYIKNGKKFVVK